MLEAHNEIVSCSRSCRLDGVCGILDPCVCLAMYGPQYESAWAPELFLKGLRNLPFTDAPLPEETCRATLAVSPTVDRIPARRPPALLRRLYSGGVRNYARD
jgi:hypothetical protein